MRVGRGSLAGLRRHRISRICGTLGGGWNVNEGLSTLTTGADRPYTVHAARRSVMAVTGDAHPAAAPGAGREESRPVPLVAWARVGAACGVVAGLAYGLAAAAPVTSALALVAATVFGPALVGFSLGLYHVLRAHRRTITLDLALIAYVAAGVTVTLMFFSQLGINRWFDLQFGSGSTDSSERALHAAFEAANGIQLGLDVAWDMFLCIATILVAWNMWHHPRFGRLLALSGGIIAAAMIVLNLAAFPEPPAQADSVDLGPVIGLWSVIVAVRLAMAVRWAAAHDVPEA